MRKVTASSGVISTIAGTGTAGYSGDGKAATSAQLRGPLGVAVDSNGNVYVADTENHAIRRIDATSGLIHTVAGNGVAAVDRLDQPRKLNWAPNGNLVISDFGNHAVKSLTIGSAPSASPSPSPSPSASPSPSPSPSSSGGDRSPWCCALLLDLPAARRPQPASQGSLAASTRHRTSVPCLCRLLQT